jgi:hypothetical protein
MRHILALVCGLAAGPVAAGQPVDIKTAEQIMACTERVGQMINRRYGDPNWTRVSSGDGKAVWLDRKTRVWEAVECDDRGVFVLKSWRQVD